MQLLKEIKYIILDILSVFAIFLLILSAVKDNKCESNKQINENEIVSPTPETITENVQVQQPVREEVIELEVEEKVIESVPVIRNTADQEDEMATYFREHLVAHTTDVTMDYIIDGADAFPRHTVYASYDGTYNFALMKIRVYYYDKDGHMLFGHLGENGIYVVLKDVNSIVEVIGIQNNNVAYAKPVVEKVVLYDGTEIYLD